MSNSSDSEPGSTRESSQQREEDVVRLKRLVQKFVRCVLSLEVDRSTISRASLVKSVWTDLNESLRVIKFQTVLREAQKHLQDTFGLRLEPLPKKVATNFEAKRRAVQKGDTDGSAKNTTSYILVSIIPQEYRKAMYRQFRHRHRLAVRRNLAEVDARAVQTRDSGEAFSKRELTLSGFVLVVVSLVVINSNHVTELELRRWLARIYCSGDHRGASHVENAALEKTLGQDTAELLKVVERYGYIQRHVEKSDDPQVSDAISFSVGPRAKVELSESAVREWLKRIYGPVWESVEAKARSTLQEVFRPHDVESGDENSQESARVES